MPQLDLQIHLSAIIFDYGQVLCQPQPPADRQAMADVLRLPQAEFDQNYWRHRLAYDAASLDAESYWSNVAQRTVTPADLERLTTIDGQSWTHPDPLMIDWARRLRAGGMRTAVLSNMPEPVLVHLKNAGWLPDFDQLTFSCDVRLAKPAPEIYEHCLRGLGCSASDVLFLDDRPENVDAAEALGIHSILYSNVDDLAKQLDRRFATPAPLIATLE